MPAQLKKANNGNHFLVLTEGNRHKETGDIRKTRLFVYSEDFAAFFRMLHGSKPSSSAKTPCPRTSNAGRQNAGRSKVRNTPGERRPTTEKRR